MADKPVKKKGRPLTWTDEKVENHATGLLKFMRDPKNFWLKDYCIENEFPSDLLSEWADRNVPFRQALKMAKDIQESRLVKLGLSKKYNPAMPIFALKNVARWRDKEQDESDTSNAAEIVKVFASMVSLAGTGQAAYRDNALPDGTQTV